MEAPTNIEQSRDTTGLQIRFTGKATEYFQIWAINLALTLLTLGVYSAWAKVRKNRYIYGNTWIGDSSFDYVAKPQRIIVSRIIAVAALVTLYIASQYLLIAAGATLYIVSAILVGLIVVLALRFRLRNTVWRNMHFRFDGTKMTGFALYSVGGLLSLLSLGLLYPYFIKKRKRFLVRSTLFANRRFRFSGESGTLYLMYFLALLIALACILSIPVLLVLLINVLGGKLDLDPDTLASAGLAAGPIAFIAITVCGYLFLFLPVAYTKSRLFRYTWNNTHYGQTSFSSTIGTWRLWWIYITNAIVMPLSLGLLYPWATLRLIRYRTESIYVHTTDDLDEMMGHIQDDSSALGEEIGDVFDVDIG